MKPYLCCHEATFIGKISAAVKPDLKVKFTYYNPSSDFTIPFLKFWCAKIQYLQRVMGAAVGAWPHCLVGGAAPHEHGWLHGMFELTAANTCMLEVLGVFAH